VGGGVSIVVESGGSIRISSEGQGMRNTRWIDLGGAAVIAGILTLTAYGTLGIGISSSSTVYQKNGNGLAIYVEPDKKL
jgi:hypothetical protein